MWKTKNQLPIKSYQLVIYIYIRIYFQKYLNASVQSVDIYTRPKIALGLEIYVTITLGAGGKFNEIDSVFTPE